jgi:Domain of unknown function (DUF4349)
METKIEYLQHLERDLKTAAREEERRGREAELETRRRKHRMPWASLAAVIVALLLIAGAVGYFANKSAVRMSAYSVGAAISGSPSHRLAPGTVPMPSPVGKADLRESATYDSGAISGTSTQGNASTGSGQPSCTACTQVDLTKIVKDGTMSIVVPKGGFNAGFEAATKVADDLGGFVLSSSISGTTSGTLTIRVPSHQFDDAIVGLHRLGKVESEQITGQDVTANYIDLRAHLKILKTDRQVLLGFLAKAHTVNDVLNLHSRLDNVQEQIDQYQGRLNVLTNQIAESTIKVSIREEGTNAPEADSNVDNPNLGTSLHRGVQGFLRVIGFVVVGLGYLVPIAVIIFLISIGLRFTRRSRETQPSYSPTATRTETTER